MAKTSGVKISDLAKELHVEPRKILAKLKDEGLGDKAKTHNSSISFGLAETVREWFVNAGGGVATAVEEPAPAEAEAEVAEHKPKPRARRKKADGTDEPHEEAPHEATDHTAVAESPAAPEVEEPKAPAVEHEAEPASEPAEATPVVETPEPVAPSPEPEVVEPPAAPVAEAATPLPASPPEGAPVAATSAPAPAAAPHAGPHHRHRGKGDATRPTVTLKTRPGHSRSEAVIERKNVTPAPQLVPEPAKMQGPRVVREEAPDVLPTPRARRPLSGMSASGTMQARPQTGRGVRSAGDEEEGESTEAAKKKANKSGRTLSSRRRGPDGRRGEAMEKLKEWSEQDLAERRDRLAAAASYRAGFEGDLKKKSERGQHAQAKPAHLRGEPVEIEEPVTVRSLSSALGVKTNEILVRLMRQGVMANINATLDNDMAAMIALDYGVELMVAPETSMEDQLVAEFDDRDSDPANFVPRPPVVTILGHVDHGKTSLLDKIRQANVAAGEAGGITQHTAAWMVQLGEKRVTFVDTPGHQAFTAMRARGANLTDVVVLVVSAAEGVQPQTIESINHARAAGVPIVVALNKIDRADANAQSVLSQLAGQQLNPVEWGGDVEVVRTSALTGQGIPELIETLDYQSQLLDLKTDPTLAARGVVIESRMDPGMGSVATVLVQEGTLRVGDSMLCGSSYGRVRMIVDDLGKSIPEATAAMPVVVAGLDAVPNAGDRFFIVDDAERGRMIAGERQTRLRQEQLSSRTKVSLENLYEAMRAGNVKEIRLIIKGDVQGTVETLGGAVMGANTNEVKVRVIHTGVGPVTESDVELADASDAVIIGFHVVPDDAARAMAEQRRVEIRLYRVIYEILDDLKKALSGLLEPEIREKYHGRVEIREVFKISKVGNIAGCMVTDGHVTRSSKIRLIRNGVVVTEDLTIESLRRQKDDTKEVRAGFECGIKLANYDDIKTGDTLEAYVRETIQRTL